MIQHTQRCAWAGSDPLYVAYHDREWGIPIHDDSRLFELITLEGAQAGLSWLTVLRKRQGYREAFAGFDPQRVAGFNGQRIDQLLKNPAIIRHRGKLESTVNNARRVLALWDSGQTLDHFIWSFVDGSPVQNCWTEMAQVPASTPLSGLMSKALKKKGFRFFGETTCYAFMQAAGLVNDHLVTCPQYAHCKTAAGSVAEVGELQGNT